MDCFLLREKKMMKKSTLKFRFILMVCFLQLTSGISMGQVPQYISYQGKIMEDGIAFSGSRTVTFSLWATDSGGEPSAALWNETQTVEIVDGIYNVQLGDDTSLPTDLHTNDELYLQVDILHPTQGIQRLEPLMPFSSTMYALKAANSDSLDGLDSHDFVGINGGTMTGPLNLSANGLFAGTDQLVLNSGNVGIGTAVPAHTLDVEGDINTSGVLMMDNTPIFVIDDINVNTFIGPYTGVANTTGIDNTFIGIDSGRRNNEGDSNTFIGKKAGEWNATGNSNTFVGAQAGERNALGHGNTFIGKEAGHQNETGSNNVFIGSRAGYSEQGSNKLYIDNSGGISPLIYGDFEDRFVRIAGNFTVSGNISSPSIRLKNDDGNVFIGYDAAGVWGSTGTWNTFVGDFAGHLNEDGSYNTFIGKDAGYSNTTGYLNTFIGLGAGYLNTGGIGNTAIGLDAGHNNETGHHNTFIGRAAGYYSTGRNNVFMGYEAGRSEMGSNKLYITNIDTTEPLIYGEFDNSFIRINGDFEATGEIKGYAKITDTTNISDSTNFIDRVAPLQIGDSGGTQLLIDGNQIEQANQSTSVFINYKSSSDVVLVNGGGNVGVGTSGPSYKLDVNGNIRCSNLTQTSDQRLKTNVHEISNALDKIKDIRGVTFDWNEKSGFKTSPKKQIGVVAQEVEAILPELVSTDKDGYKSVEYTKLTAVLIEAVKEQQITINKLNAKIDNLETNKMVEIDTLKGQFHQLQIMMKNMVTQNLDQKKEKLLLSME
ncbi:MAG: hypothetical protein DRH93_15690 [Deltaproteobacteria bacterium]|nr:MAG: hypothetical protein DRH93_15690 [Deltaproteobacteria bacterium]